MAKDRRTPIDINAPKMRCMHCGRATDGVELSKGAVSAVCPTCANAPGEYAETSEADLAVGKPKPAAKPPTPAKPEDLIV